MSTQTILNVTLTLHLIALATAIGITLASAIANSQFWKLYDKNKEKGLAAFRATAKFRVFGMFSFLLLIFTGLIMLGIHNWTLVALLWFKLKLFIVLLLFVNGFTMGRITFTKLEAILKGEHADSHSEIIRLRRNVRIFQFTQLSLFVLIIILSVFRFT